MSANKLRLALTVGIILTGILAALIAELSKPREVMPYVPTYIVLYILATTLIAIGLGILLSKDGRRARPTLNNVLSLWWFPVAFSVVGISIWISMAFMSNLVNSSQDPTKRVELKVDAVKTSLTVGAGVAGGVALLLGMRRQRLGELTQSHLEYDSTERRVTELYSKAADQLGHDKAAVRLAGLYALERVGQGYADHRQTIVDVICAYLRMSPSPDTATEQLAVDDVDSPSNAHEIQVRLTAQNILTKHLTWRDQEKQAPDTFWSNIDIDLSGSRLHEFNLDDCRVRKAVFKRAIFEGASFIRAKFEGIPWGSTGPHGLGGAIFSEATFEGDVLFEDARFFSDISFMDCEFEYDAYFGGVEFWTLASFDGARFGSDLQFEGSRFKLGASFTSAKFAGSLNFSAGYIYALAADFSESNDVDFSRAEFKSTVFFNGVNFGEDSDSTNINFQGIKIENNTNSKRVWPDGWREVATEGDQQMLHLVPDKEQK